VTLIRWAGGFFFAIAALTLVAYGPAATLTLLNHWLANVSGWFSRWQKSHPPQPAARPQ
jgi:hypothetical protein